MAKHKNPSLAAGLAFVFGPLGFLYIGWRYATMALVMVATFFAAVLFFELNFPMPWWGKFLTELVLAWKGYTICAGYNEWIDSGGEQIQILSSFPCATLAMTDLLVGIGAAWASILGLSASIMYLSEGMFWTGLAMLFIGTPVLAYVASTLLGWITMAIDLPCMALLDGNPFGRR